MTVNYRVPAGGFFPGCWAILLCRHAGNVARYVVEGDGEAAAAAAAAEEEEEELTNSFYR